MIALWAGWAFAHHPHDPIDLIDMSPAFATDQMLIGTRNPGQNWRANEIVTSGDGGFSWWPAYKGMNHDADVVAMGLSPSFDIDGIAMVTTDGDGLFLTQDGAASWTQLMPGLELGAGVIATDSTGALILLVHEVGVALWRSDDLGATFTEALLPGSVYTLHASGSEVVLGEGTLVRSSQDAGLTWDVVDLGTTVLDVAAGPGVRVVGTDTGAFLSTAVGSYEPIDGSTGAPTTMITAVGVSPDWPADPLVLLAELVDGPFVSSDGGASFIASPTGVSLSFQDPIHFFSFRMSPNFGTDQTVLLNTWEGLIISHDRGQSWDELDTRTPGMITGIGVSPTYDVDGTVIIGTFDAGLAHSVDAGATFDIHNVGLTRSSIYDVDMGTDIGGDAVAMIGLRDKSGWGAPPYDRWERRPFLDQYSTRTALHPDFATTQIALQGHRSYGVLRTADAGFTWMDTVPGNLSAITALAWNADGSIALAGTKSGQLLTSLDLGQSWAVHPTLPVHGEPLFVAGGPDGFLVGTGEGLYTTVDGLTLTPDATLTGTVHMVGAAADGTRFVSMRGQGFFRSDPGLGAWTEVGPELSAHGSPHELAVSPTFATDGTLFASIDEWLYRSDDRGDSFQVMGPVQVRYEEDAAQYRNSGDPLRTVATMGGSVERMAQLPAGESLSLSFRGTGIRWLGMRGGGIADVEIDGVVVMTVDTAGAPVPQEVMFEDLSLTDAVHTVRLIHVGGGDVLIDAMEVVRPLPVTTPPPVDTGDTGDPGTSGTTPPTYDTGIDPPTDGSTDDPGVPATDEPSDKDGGCGCQSGPASPVALWLAALTMVALRRRLETP